MARRMIRQNFLALGALDRQPRRAHHLRAEPVSCIASLMYCTSLTLVSRCSSGVYQRYNSRACVPLARRRQVPQRAILVRERVHQARNPALRAEQDALQHQVVHAAEEDVAIAHDVAQVGDAADIFGRFLDGDEVRLIRQLARSISGVISTLYETGLL